MTLPEDRQTAIRLVKQACRKGARKREACKLLGVSVRTLERWERHGAQDQRKSATRKVANKLSYEEREMILKIANSKKYCDLPPCQIVPILADQGIYIGSESSFYRVLRQEKQLAHRGRARMPAHQKPKAYKATGPNQVWSWDITYLPSQVLGLHFYLYVMMDIFSRKIVGWSVHERQSADYAAQLAKQACIDEGINQNQLILHSDNGGPMKGASMLAMLDKLGVTPSFSRPSVSDDNPYSEALFKTLKYRPKFPATARFADIDEAREWCMQFVSWYNCEHRHSGLKFITPEQRHNGADVAIMRKRKQVLEKAKMQHPERWANQTRDWSLPESVWLNPARQIQLGSTCSQLELSMAA